MPKPKCFKRGSARSSSGENPAVGIPKLRAGKGPAVETKTQFLSVEVERDAPGARGLGRANPAVDELPGFGQLERAQLFKRLRAVDSKRSRLDQFAAFLRVHSASIAPGGGFRHATEFLHVPVVSRTECPQRRGRPRGGRPASARKRAEGKYESCPRHNGFYAGGLQ
ncbi:MAG: hypothetical protein COX66_15980, partial [Elusimicrobia bacterium CG_4_10_14_0_2_um_filter_63_34]